MSLAQTYAPGRFGLSFELFPPKTPAGEAALYEHVTELVKLHPSFITCTYGAGGSTRDKTLEIVTRVREQFRLPVASHLTCVGSTPDQLRSYLKAAQMQGVDYIVALRGDPPKGEAVFTPVEGGFRYASELVDLIHREFPWFEILVAGYPEKHQEAASLALDLENLHRKVLLGGSVVLTQLFYDNADFLNFRRLAEQRGIRAPIVPGILPVTNLAQIQRITSLCGARLPEEFVRELGRKDDEAWQFQVGVEFAARQVQELIDQGVPGLHFYVLNKSQATKEVLQRVKLP